ncbi:MAG: DUF3108 domain-containing protein [Gammaproteobacteria bacterium]|nr:DUF3108 domain-containing protein [Gammaproteobacteria bacterium]
MIKKRYSIFLLVLYLSSSIAALADTDAFETMPKLPFLSGETLHYKLSYRGLLTSMIWADIADAKMTFIADMPTPGEQTGYQFVLQLSTENYLKAEVIQPVRYTYTTTLDASLQRTLLVEEIDTGGNQSHDFLWLDWRNKETQLFKKREKKQLNSGILGLGSKEYWENDGELPIPQFLNGFPELENHQTYLIHKESGDKIERSTILDPLSMIYILRTMDISARKEIAIAISDDIRLYRIENAGIEALQVGGKEYQAIKYKIQTDEKKDNSYHIWLNHDTKKIPLRLAMNAPLGRLEIDLVKITHVNEGYSKSGAGPAALGKLPASLISPGGERVVNKL